MTVRVVVSRSAWFSQQQVGGAAGVKPPIAPDPTVPEDGSLAVAGPVTGTPERPRKEAYLALDLAAVPAGARVTSFTLGLPTVAQSTPPPALVAVAATSAFADKQFNQPASAAPSDDTSAAAPLTLDAGTPPAYTLTSVALGQRLLDTTATGIGLRPADATTTAQAVLAPATAITAELGYEVAGDAAATGGSGSASVPNGIAGGPAAPAGATPSVIATAAGAKPTGRQAPQAGPPAPAALPTGASGVEPQNAAAPVGAPVAIAAAPLSAALPAAPPGALPGVAAAQPAVAADGAPAQDGSGDTTGAIATGLRPVAALRSGGVEGAPLTLLFAILLLLGVLAVAATSLTLPAVAPERGLRRPTRPAVRREPARPLP